LFSTTIGCPSRVAILLKSTRLTTSLALPPANGMITVIGRLGKPCALALSATKTAAAHNAIAHDLLNFMLLPEYESAPLNDGADIVRKFGHTLWRNSISAS
jgi:hypothetical protein